MSFLRLAIIMAGGTGERFWPLSHAKRPKQLLKLTHPELTLLEEAIGRIAPLISRENVVIATTRALEAAIREASGNIRILAEPDKRNTLGCLCWAAANLIADYGDRDVSMAVITADHKIGNEAEFRSTVSRALVTAEQTGALVTIGMKPTRPETGYGYIELPESAIGSEPQKVSAIHEKPDLDLAQKYFAGGKHLWNSGMFFWTVEAFMRELQGAQPEAHRITVEMTEELRKGRTEGAADLFRNLPSQSVDYALMERAKNVFVVPGDFPWDDVGAWDSLQRSFERNAEGNVVLGKVTVVDSTGCVLVNESHRKVGVLGLNDIVVVVSPDGVLVCHKDRTQEVRKISAELD